MIIYLDIINKQNNKLSDNQNDLFISNLSYKLAL